MNRALFSLLFICCFTLSIFAQKNEIVVTIADTKVSKAEFERIFKKNNNNLYNESDKKSPEDYLELFIDFKLKVIEAESLQMDTNSVFVNEFEGYRKELATPYLTDVKFNEQLVKELYDRMNKEVNASHILLQVKKSATDAEDQAVLNRINKIKKEIDLGKDFAEAAAEYSEDPSAKSNKGNLSYFTAFQMIAPFENVAFTTPAGNVSESVRSAFGYHLIMVHDVRKNRGEIQVAHIMKMLPKGATPVVKEELKKEIYNIYIELQNGADFSELAKTRSDDKNSAAKGGEMPWFAAGRMIKEFSDPAFALQNKGDYTPPIETQYGYHIIKKIDSRGIASFEDSKESIVSRIKKDPARSTSSKTAFTNKLKLEYNFIENPEGIKLLSDVKVGDNFSELDFELFNLYNKPYTIKAFQNYIQEKEITTGTYKANFDKWVEDEITKLEDSRLEEKYPDFRYTIKEYHDGILLFNISEEKIWNYASEDSVGLQVFYEKSKNKHVWEERFKGSIIVCKDEATREETDKYFGAEMTNIEILDLINKEEEKITITEGAWEKGSNSIVDYFVWNKNLPENLEGNLTFIRGDKVQPEPKTLKEARGLYISDYQNYIEKKWLKELRKKYKIKVNKKLLKTIEGV
ncbi:MAG: peptidylprolyl isomerase [Bacteroidetes bacterium]|nr:peptidylprolyl isomerase [Bacteroidota bacterium]